jgi:hypothetical protein
MTKCSDCDRLRGESATAFAEYTAAKDELAITSKRDKSHAVKRRALKQAEGRLRECHSREKCHRMDAHNSPD